MTSGEIMYQLSVVKWLLYKKNYCWKPWLTNQMKYVREPFNNIVDLDWLSIYSLISWWSSSAMSSHGLWLPVLVNESGICTEVLINMEICVWARFPHWMTDICTRVSKAVPGAWKIWVTARTMYLRSICLTLACKPQSL